MLLQDNSLITVFLNCPATPPCIHAVHSGLFLAGFSDSFYMPSGSVVYDMYTASCILFLNKE